MKTYKLLLSYFLLSMTLVYAVNTATPETDNKQNPEMLNTLGPVVIMDLTGKDANGTAIDEFRITSLPTAEQGVLYMEDGATPVSLNMVYCKTDTDGFKFDPTDGFVGDATFTYASLDTKYVQDDSSATFTIPVVASNANTDNNTTTDSNGTVGSGHTVHNANCGCSDYDESIPSLTLWSILLLLTGTSFLSFFLVRKELV